MPLLCRYPELSFDLPTSDSLSGERLIVEATAIPGSFKAILCDGCHEEINGALTSIANRARVTPEHDRFDRHSLSLSMAPNWQAPSSCTMGCDSAANGIASTRSRPWLCSSSASSSAPPPHSQAPAASKSEGLHRLRARLDRQRNADKSHGSTPWEIGAT